MERRPGAIEDIDRAGSLTLNFSMRLSNRRMIQAGRGVCPCRAAGAAELGHTQRREGWLGSPAARGEPPHLPVGRPAADS